MTLLLLSSPVLPARARRLPLTAEIATNRASEVEVASPSGGWTATADVGASTFGASELGVGVPESSTAGVGTSIELSGEFKLIFARRWADHRPCIERFNAFEPYLSAACKQYTCSRSATTYRDLYVHSVPVCLRVRESEPGGGRPSASGGRSLRRFVSRHCPIVEANTDANLFAFVRLHNAIPHFSPSVFSCITRNAGGSMRLQAHPCGSASTSVRL